MLIGAGIVTLHTQNFLPTLIDQIPLIDTPGINQVSAEEYARFGMARGEDLESIIENSGINPDVISRDSFRGVERDILFFPEGISLDTVVTLDRDLPRETAGEDDEEVSLTETGTLAELTYDSGDQQAPFMAFIVNDRVIGLLLWEDTDISFDQSQDFAVLRPGELNRALR